MMVKTAPSIIYHIPTHGGYFMVAATCSNLSSFKWQNTAQSAHRHVRTYTKSNGSIYRCLCSITIRTMEKWIRCIFFKIQESINTDPNKECIRLLTLWKWGAVNWVANNTNKECMLRRRLLQKSILTVLELINSGGSGIYYSRFWWSFLFSNGVHCGWL